MRLTEEQEQVLATNKDIKINAVAGSGKTTLLTEYARSRPGKSGILYLAFNRTVRDDAARRFRELGLDRVRCETAHSLAYKYFGRGFATPQIKGYKSHEVAELLGLHSNSSEAFVLANHILKFSSYFCNSNQAKVMDLDYKQVVHDREARSFVQKHYELIQQGTRMLLAKMHQGSTGITHDFYLKQFQLEQHRLPYDYILFDEGQDASGAMLDIFLKQDAVKVIVGDTHQQIYSWRYAVNSLEQVDCPGYRLSNSFRFGEEVADLAADILNWKSHFKAHYAVPIKGRGKSGVLKTRATLARTNLSLLTRAIEFMLTHKRAKLYFEGNIQSYTYADEGASLYDVYNLYFGKTDRVRDPLLRSLNNIDELKTYIEQTEDHELAMLLGVIDEYGKEVPQLIQQLKDCHVADEDKHKADMIFSTVHRCKGMEYDEVTLAGDFMTEEKILKTVREAGKDKPDVTMLNEEVNLLYVAATRTRNLLHLPEELAGKREGGKVQSIAPPVPQKPMVFRSKATASAAAKEKPAPRRDYTNAYQPWTDELDEELTRLFRKNWDEYKLADHFGRKPGAISARIKKLELYERYR